MVTGDLYLVGGGDPLLRQQPYPDGAEPQGPPSPHTSFEALADAIVAAGVTSISGSVRGRREPLRRGAAGADLARRLPAVAEGGPLSALLVNDGSHVVRAGGLAADPRPARPRVLDRAAPGARGHRRRAPARAVPADATEVARIESVPMPRSSSEMLTTSDNNTGRAAPEGDRARAGRRAAHRRRRSRWCARRSPRWGVPTERRRVADGSGLDGGNRADVPCSSWRAGARQPCDRLRSADGLAVGAVKTGTLARRASRE